MERQELASRILSLVPQSIPYELGRRLAPERPGRFFLETEDSDFDPDAYAEAGLCVLTRLDAGHSRIDTDWDRFRSRCRDVFKSGHRAVEWSGKRMELVTLHWSRDSCENARHLLVAESEADARAFFGAVCAWNTEVRDEVLVFEEGHWSKSEDLFRAIRGASFENLILAGDLKRELWADAERFFASETLYEGYGVPWKRGVLLLGPPGNGKTHAVKALINVLGKPCLYVKSFATRQTTDGWSIRQVFGRARESAPCVLVLEDLDSLITDKNRSFFLNELDGFAANRGILTLASTNHPDRLDPAIVNRPSRFDRKFHFDLPAVAERRAYIAMWNRTLKPELRLTEAGLDRAAESTAGFSFAYLKELFVSAVMGWMHSAKPGAMDAVIEEHVAALRREMVSSTARVAGFAAPTA